MSIILRPAVEADQPIISQLVHAVRLNPMRLAWENFLIAEETDSRVSLRVVGIGQLRPHADGILELASLVVVPEARGNGVGSQLVDALIGKANRPLYLMCDNTKVAYYQRFGFYEVTSRQEVPRSLRWIHRIATTLEAILALFSAKPPRIAIMAHPGQQKID